MDSDKKLFSDDTKTKEKEEKHFSSTDVDQVEEYFKSKDELKEIRKHISECTQQHEDYEELKKLKSKMKVLNEKIRGDGEIKDLRVRSKTVKERMELMKEIIRIDLVNTGKDKVTKDGKALKLVYVVKETRDEEKSSSE